MNRNITLFILFLILSFNCLSQKSEIFVDLNFGTFTNIPLRSFHNELASDINFEGLKTTDNFNFNYGFSIGFKVNKINTSFFYSQKVAGSKTSLADFSGFITLTNEIKGSTFGGLYEEKIRELGKGNLFLGVKGLITFSKLILSDNNSITYNNESYNFKSIDFGTGILITYKANLGPIIIKPFIGIDIYVGGKLKFEDFNEAHLTFKNGNTVKTGWTGLNAGLGIALPFF